jgi:hypothetical protein
MRQINRKIFTILLTLCILGTLAVFPYVVTLQKDVFSKLPIPIAVVILAQVVQSTVIFAVAIAAGLYLARVTGFTHPVLTAISEKKDRTKPLVRMLRLSLISGIVAALAIFGLDYLFSLFQSTISVCSNPAPIWQRLLAALYGGIVEEVLMRLFLVSLLTWIGMKLTGQLKPSRNIIITAIVLAAIIFGLGHLPVTAALTKITPLIVARAVILNGVGGIIFGWLYWKKGLESAMIAHFTTDIFLLSILPLLVR